MKSNKNIHSKDDTGEAELVGQKILAAICKHVVHSHISHLME